MQKDIIVTGATGFLGKRLLPLLIKKYGKKCIVCFLWSKNNKKETKGKLFLKKLGVKIILGDLITGEGLDKLPKSPKLVFHLAANTETLEPDHRCNNIGTKNLANVLNLSKSSHFIHISTLVLFAGRIDCSKPLIENSTPFPTNEYTRTKLEGEKFLIEECKKKKFCLTVIRPNTIYGSSMRDNSLIDVMKKIVKKNSFLARINWPGKSSLIYVEDMANAVLLLSSKNKRAGTPKIYNIDPEQLSLSDISKEIYKVNGLTYKPITVPSFVWKVFAYSRRYIFLLEKFLPLESYNWLWRFTILVDDVIYCSQKEIKKAIPTWKPHKFTEVANQL